MFARKIGIDLGTCNSLVFLPQKGIVLNEPSVVAVSPSENKIIAVGAEAKEMIGRAPETIKIYRPLKDGVIADYRVTQAMIRYFMEKSLGSFRIFKPDLVISVPAGITSTEKRAVREAALSAGARECYLVKEPILSAIGAGVPINSTLGHMIIDIGGGTTEIAVISLGGIVTSNSVRVAGDKLDEAIASFIRRKYNLAIGSQTAEEIKIRIGTAISEENEEYFEIKGSDLGKGLPRTIKISSNEIYEAIKDTLDEIVKAVKRVLRETPPELSADIIDRGIVIAGGGALLRNIDALFSKETGVPSFVADEPLLCVAKGTGAILENLDLYRRSIMSRR